MAGPTCSIQTIDRVAPRFTSSGDQLLDNLAENIGEAVVPSLMLVGKPFMVDAQEVQDRGVEIMHVDARGDDAVTEWIGRAVGDAGLDAATGRPGGEAARVMIAPVVGGRQFSLAVIGAAELAPPEHQGVVEHAALLQVRDQGRAGLVGFAALLADAAGQTTVMVPAGVIELDETHVALGQPAGQEAVGRERPGFPGIRTVAARRRARAHP